MAFDNKAMVGELISENRLDPEVAEAMRRVDRRLFMPQNALPVAYNNVPVDIGPGRVMAPPGVVGSMLSMARLRVSSNVLEIGTDLGYATAVAAELTREGKITTFEDSYELHNAAKQNFSKLSRPVKVEFVFGDGAMGYWNSAPYDVIIANGAYTSLTRELIQQLKIDGRLVFPMAVGSVQQIMCYDRMTNSMSNEITNFKFRMLVKE